MRLFVYVMQDELKCWAYNVLAKIEHSSIYVHTLFGVAPAALNIHNKDNLDRALLLISLGLPHKEIEELLNDSN